MSKSIAFALPVAAGKREAGMKLIEELTGGKSGDFHARRQQHGFDRIKIFHQTEPTEQVIVYLEGENVPDAMSSKTSDTHEFEQYFDSVVQEITGRHPSKHGAPPSTLLMDWHKEKGASRTHH